MRERPDSELRPVAFQSKSENPLVYECEDGTRIYLTFFLQSIKRKPNPSGRQGEYTYEFEMSQNTQIISPKDVSRRRIPTKVEGS